MAVSPVASIARGGFGEPMTRGAWSAEAVRLLLQSVFAEIVPTDVASRSRGPFVGSRSLHAPCAMRSQLEAPASP
jgi:hypothetical protein